MRRLQLFGKILLVVVLGVLTLEVAFRVAGFFQTPSRGTENLQKEHFVVLCVGDSHTWGAGKGYPARLAERLAGESSNYRVVNMGVPGSNTAQVRRKLPDYLDRIQPDLVVLWAGVNNKYNRAESDLWKEAGVEETSFGRSLLDSSRILRFFRLWQNERELNRFLEQADTYVKPADGGGAETLPVEEGKPFLRFRRGLFGETDVFEHVRGDKLSPERMTEVTELDVRRIKEELDARGIPLIAITYPLQGGWFGEANRGIRAALEGTSADVVESPDVLENLKKGMRRRGEKFAPTTFFDPSVHPHQILYDAIGDEVLAVARRTGKLPAPSAPLGTASPSPPTP